MVLLLFSGLNDHLPPPWRRDEGRWCVLPRGGGSVAPGSHPWCSHSPDGCGFGRKLCCPSTSSPESQREGSAPEVTCGDLQTCRKMPGWPRSRSGPHSVVSADPRAAGGAALLPSTPACGLRPFCRQRRELALLSPRVSRWPRALLLTGLASEASPEAHPTLLSSPGLGPSSSFLASFLAPLTSHLSRRCAHSESFERWKEQGTRRRCLQSLC